MAMGLGFLGGGRSCKWMRACIALLGGSILGGAVAGAAIGALGWALRLPRAAPWLVAAAVLAAAWLGIRQPARSLGLQRQVRRRWPSAVAAGVMYFLWGVTLGTGVLTVIPYSAFLVLVTAEAVAGPLAAGVAGAVFGAGRALVAIAQGSREPDPQRTMDLLPRLRPALQKANVVAVPAGGATIAGLLAVRW